MFCIKKILNFDIERTAEPDDRHREASQTGCQFILLFKFLIVPLPLVRDLEMAYLQEGSM